MRQSTLILIALALVSLFAFAISLSSATAPNQPLRVNRFLAGIGNGNGPKNKKCSLDPYVCQGYSACCGDNCVDLNTDPLNCGKCGKICKFTDSCCGGKCVDLNYDKRNCGSCGNKCNKGVLCYYGMCNYA